MTENRESEFAFTMGQMIGFLYNPEIIELLKERGTSETQITAVAEVLRDMAKKTFYGDLNDK